MGLPREFRQPRDPGGSGSERASTCGGPLGSSNESFVRRRRAVSHGRRVPGGWDRCTTWRSREGGPVCGPPRRSVLGGAALPACDHALHIGFGLFGGGPPHRPAGDPTPGNPAPGGFWDEPMGWEAGQYQRSNRRPRDHHPLAGTDPGPPRYPCGGIRRGPARKKMS